MPTCIHYVGFTLLYVYSSAQVSVQLRNVGTDAFRPSDYGESITIERRIAVDGGSSYRVKSSKGECPGYSQNMELHVMLMSCSDWTAGALQADGSLLTTFSDIKRDSH